MYKILLSALLTASNSNSQLIGGKILQNEVRLQIAKIRETKICTRWGNQR
jgi:hypothetical protein